MPKGYLGANLKLTAMPFVMKSVALALRRHPLLNATLDEENEQVVYKQYVHLGIAVDTPRGLVVPKVRNADRMSIPELARALASLAERARAVQFSIDELRGGTFTISNLGAVGGAYSTPIINHPEVAILLLGRSRWMPMVREGNVEPRFMMPLSLSYDHRLVDGATAGRFLNGRDRSAPVAGEAAAGRVNGTLSAGRVRPAHSRTQLSKRNDFMDTQLVVLGGGPGGYAAAFLAADMGMQVTLVDRENRLGGVCLLRGCIPSKALLHVAKAMTEAEHLAEWGVHFTKPKIELDAVRARKDKVIATLTGGLKQLAKKRKVNVVRAKAAFEGLADIASGIGGRKTVGRRSRPLRTTASWHQGRVPRRSRRSASRPTG